MIRNYKIEINLIDSFFLNPLLILSFMTLMEMQNVATLGVPPDSGISNVLFEPFLCSYLRS